MKIKYLSSLLFLTLVFCTSVPKKHKFFYEKLGDDSQKKTYESIYGVDSFVIFFSGNWSDKVEVETDNLSVDNKIREEHNFSQKRMFYYFFKKPKNQITLTINGYKIVIPKSDFENYHHLYLKKYTNRYNVYLSNRNSFDGPEKFIHTQKN